jgi:hypothetical protein
MMMMMMMMIMMMMMRGVCCVCVYVCVFCSVLQQIRLFPPRPVCRGSFSPLLETPAQCTVWRDVLPPPFFTHTHTPPSPSPPPDVFKQRLGLVLEREDEIGCAVGGCNFLLRTITHEAFVFEAGQAQFVPCSSEWCGGLCRGCGCVFMGLWAWPCV